jgi:hypothetical protein
LKVIAPPKLHPPECGADASADAHFLQIGYFINSGYVGYQWKNGDYLDNCALFATLELWNRRKKVAATFEEWLKRTFIKGRNLYSKSEWKSILEPVSPFSPQEQQIIKAISHFSFRKIGVSEKGNILVEITNHSDIRLPYLSIGVKLSSESEGKCALPTREIDPGTSRIVEHPIYRNVADPHTIELFRLPIPDPEDRVYYLEFSH